MSKGPSLRPTTHLTDCSDSAKTDLSLPLLIKQERDTENVDLAENAGADNVSDIFANAAAIELDDRDVPTTLDGFLTYHPDPKFTSWNNPRLIGYYIIQLKKHRDLSRQERQAVFDILKSLSNLEDLTKPVAEKWAINRLLLGIMGESAQATAPYAFPPPFPTAAEMIMTRIEANTGFEEDISGEETAPSTTPPPHSPTRAGTGPARKRKRAIPSHPSPVERPAVNLDDPEFRTLMRNIKRSSDGRKTYSIADKSLIVSHHPFGHNGLHVGDWWPYRICALRDGAHGSSQGGISGNEKFGARSIMAGGKHTKPIP